MKKLTIITSIAVMLLIPSARIKSNDIVKADSISDNSKGYFYKIQKDGFIESTILQDEMGYYDFETLGYHYSNGIINNNNYNVDFLDFLYQSGRLAHEKIIYPGEKVIKYKKEYINNEELPLITFYDVLSDEDLETPEPLYFHAYSYEREVFVPFKEQAENISLIFGFGDTSFGDVTPVDYDDYEQYNTGGLNALINFLKPLMINYESIPLLSINDIPIARLTKMSDILKLETNSSVNAFLTDDYQFLCVDMPNPGVINKISGLEVSREFFLEDKIQLYNYSVLIAPPTYNNDYIDSPLFLENYDHLNGELIFIENEFNQNWNGYSLKSIKVDNITYSDFEIIDNFYDFTSYKKYLIYKIKSDFKKDLTTHDIDVDEIILSNGSEEKSIDGLKYQFRYINGDIHHRLAVDVSIDHWCDYSKLWFTITDIEARARILLGMSQITFGYYEEKNEWKKDNAKDLIRSVEYSRESNIKELEDMYSQSFNSKADLYEFLNKKIPSYMTYSIFTDNYGREWKLKYVRNDIDNQVEQAFSGSGKFGFDWELYTNKPGNLVYFDPELSIIYVTYTSQNGETIKCSSYKDGHYAEQIDGVWVVKDLEGNTIEGAGVLPDGIIYDEASGVLWKSPTTTTGQSLFDNINNFLSKVFTKQNILKTITLLLSISVIFAFIYLIYLKSKKDLITKKFPILPQQKSYSNKSCYRKPKSSSFQNKKSKRKLRKRNG